MMNRRKFIYNTLTTGAFLVVPGWSNSNNPTGFFSLMKKDKQWSFLDPGGSPYFSLALNHIDSASLRYKENIHIWMDKYQNSMKKWLQESVRPNILSWGFNSVGWVQEVVTRGKTNHRHSRSFTFEEYQWLDLPYCHMLPFADFHQWEAETRYPDFFSQDFADWCDYVARDHCARFAHDPKLIGYFYIDCPSWIHTVKESAWKGPLFDPERLKTEEGRKELFKIASKYYQVTHDAVRRYDPNHLILGDRYNAQRPWAKEVLLAAKPYVDVMSFQHFGKAEKIREDLLAFADITEMPILLADSGVPNYDTWEQGFFELDTGRYQQLTRVLSEIPSLVGFHFCGAFQRNKVRKYGLQDPLESTDHVKISQIKASNQKLIDLQSKI